MPSVTGISFNATGLVATVTFGAAATYSAGSITFTGAAYIGFTQGRRFATVGAPTGGDGTNTHTYAVSPGKGAVKGEVVTYSVPNTLVASGTADTGTANTASVTAELKPSLGRTRMLEQEYGNSATFEFEALHQFGIASVTVEADDGSNPAVSSVITERTESALDDWWQYIATLDLSTLDDGPITITATAAADGTTSTREISFTIRKDGTPAAVPVIYVAGTTGADANDGLTVGAPKKTLHRALLKGRQEAYAGRFIVEVLEAGTYDPDDNASGFQVVLNTDTHVPILRAAAGLDPDDVVIRPRAGNNAITWNDYNGTINVGIRVERCTINFNDTTNPEIIRQMYGGKFKDCILTCNFNAAPTLGGTGVTSQYRGPSSDPVHYEYEGCTFDRCLKVMAHARLVRDVLATKCGSDNALNMLGPIVNYRIEERGFGRAVMTITYTGAAAAATIERTGVPGSAGTGLSAFVFKEDGVTVLTLDPYHADTDTLTEFAAAVDGIAGGGWNATVTDATADTEGGSNKADWGPHNMASTGVTWNAKNLTVTFYQNNPDHSDFIQFFGDDYENIPVNGMRVTKLIDLTVYAGLGNNQQTLWWDHSPATTTTCIHLVNCYGFQHVPDINRTYNGMHHAQANFMMAFCNWDNPFLFHYEGGGAADPTSFFSGDHWVMLHCVNRSIIADADGDGTDCTFANNHYSTPSENFNTADPVVELEDSTFGGQGTTTTGALASLFTNYSTESGAMDLTPLGALLSRTYAAVDIPDPNGLERPSGSPIGAFSVVADDPAPAPSARLRGGRTNRTGRQYR
jgi:hypothetical protein